MKITDEIYNRIIKEIQNKVEQFISKTGLYDEDILVIIPRVYYEYMKTLDFNLYHQRFNKQLEIYGHKVILSDVIDKVYVSVNLD